MTSPDAPPPFAPPHAAPQPSPYAAPQPPPYAGPAPGPYAGPMPGPYAAPVLAPAYGVPLAQHTARGSSRALAIIALVAAGLALLLSLGTLAVIAIGSGAFGDPGYTLHGTAPQVVDGQPYSGERLAEEVRRVIEDDGGTVTAIDCPTTPRVGSDAVTTCTGTVDDWDERITVDFQDGEGHFTLDEQDAG